ncbi:probable LRR receptor-like serine/threonine-protein kinase At3g47570 [Dendrobium catenatum]|nr:probable LRR receptor-like serine/threonine-protein kinase At3g47570 [Dendrobium catenatum]
MNSQVSTHGDVYSYGILLLEMLTGRKPLDDSFKDGISLHIFVQNALPEHVIDIIDPILLLEENGGETVDEMLKRQECLTSMLKIGLFCSKESPRERMGIEDVIKELHSIRNKIQTLEARSESYKDKQTGEGSSHSMYSQI